MQRKFFGVIMFGLLAVLGAATASAQEAGTMVRAKIPFEFSVRGKMLPAGNYEIRETLDGSGTYTIANVRHLRDRVMFETERADAKQTPKRGELVFNRLGDRYFLAEVFDAGDPTGIAAVPSRQERAMERESAHGGAEAGAESVVIMAD